MRKEDKTVAEFRKGLEVPSSTPEFDPFGLRKKESEISAIAAELRRILAEKTRRRTDVEQTLDNS